MPLTLKTKVDRITSDNLLYIIDNTGNYDAATNPGGYGTPNLTRAGLALFHFATLKTELADVVVVVTPNNAETVAEFELTLDKDGWLELHTVGIQLLTPSLTADGRFTVGEYVYDSANSLLYVIASKTANSSLFNYTITPVTDYSLIRTQETYSNTINHLLLNELCISLNRARTKYLMSIMNRTSTCSPENELAKEVIFQMENLIQGAAYDFGLLAYYEGEKKIEWAYNVAETFNCI